MIILLIQLFLNGINKDEKSKYNVEKILTIKNAINYKVFVTFYSVWSGY